MTPSPAPLKTKALFSTESGETGAVIAVTSLYISFPWTLAGSEESEETMARQHELTVE